MAAIEKICEYSGEYPGWEMYRYKRDLIQIMPAYRKLFRNQEHYLFWFTVPDYFNSYEYCLFVPSVEGKVNGYYWNWAINPSTAKRKLKRMLRAYKGLNIRKISMDIDTWHKLKKENHNLLEYV